MRSRRDRSRRAITRRRGYYYLNDRIINPHRGVSLDDLRARHRQLLNGMTPQERAQTEVMLEVNPCEAGPLIAERSVRQQLRHNGQSSIAECTLTLNGRQVQLKLRDDLEEHYLLRVWLQQPGHIGWSCHSSDMMA